MTFVFRSLRARMLALLVLIVLVLAGCGGTTTSTGTPTTGTNVTPPPITITVGGKLDTEAQLLTKMYVLLLKKAGFNVVDKSQLGTNAIVFAALKRGDIDLYPEFTGTGLFQLKINTTGNADQDYSAVKAGYESQFQITWLDKAPLNDTYGICTLKIPPPASVLSTLHTLKISDLKLVASQLTVATPPDGQSDPSSLPGLKKTYGITFGHVLTLSEAQTFTAVQNFQAQVNVCYTTRPEIADKFMLLQDDMNVAAPDNPAPIVRDSALAKAPGISAALNPLAPKLTTEVSQMLQAQVLGGKSVTEVATTWLMSVGLL